MLSETCADPRPSGASAEEGGGRGGSFRESSWKARGRALYGVPDPVPTPSVLSVTEACRAVARRLRSSLGALSEGDRDAAVAAAARGYLDAHQLRGRTICADRPTPAPRHAPEAAAAAPAPVPFVQRNSSTQVTRRFRVRAPMSAAAVTFHVTQGHVLAKGLAGGRVRIVRGESAIDAVARRIARDTRCVIVAITEEGQEAPPDGSLPVRHYRITLRGSDGTREAAGRGIEGVLWVKI